MAKLKVPSLQHLARNWRETPEGVSKKLVSVAVNPPQFSYEPLFAAARDMLVFGVPFVQVMRHRRAPRMQHRRDADIRAEILLVGPVPAVVENRSWRSLRLVQRAKTVGWRRPKETTP